MSMFCTARSILNLYFLSLASAVSVKIEAHIESPKKWTYLHPVKSTVTASSPIQENVPMKQALRMQDRSEMQDKIISQKRIGMQQELQKQSQLLQKLWSKLNSKMKDFISRNPLLKLDTSTTHSDLKMQKPHQNSDLKNEDTVSYDDNKYFFKTLTNHDHVSKDKSKHEHHEHEINQDIKDTLIEESPEILAESDQKESSSTIKQTIEKRHNKITVEITTENIFNTMSYQTLNNIIFDTNYNPHQIKYNAQVQTFILQILDSGLKVFDEMKKKTTDHAIKRKLDMLATSYTNKYEQFLRETFKQEIKTRLGTQKVILNAIDISDRILKRLVNQIEDDLDTKGYLRQNNATVNEFQQDVRKETDQQFRHLCTEIGVCRSGDGFPDFLNNFLTTILKCDDTKFRLAIDSLTEVANDIDFRNTFSKKTRKQIKETIDRIERQDTRILRAGLMVIKNIIANKNRPIVVKHKDIRNSRINSTIALLEIVEAFEVKLPRSDANIVEWRDLKTSLDEWQRGKRNDVQDIMGIFMKYIKIALDGMPSSMQEHVANNLSLLIKRH